MGAKVTFDPLATPDKLIIVGSGIGDVDVQIDIYSDGKEDWLASDFLSGFEFPLRTIGGDPVTATKFVSPRFFLASGWKIKPDERNHELTVEGDIFSDVQPPLPLHISASGNFTVSIIFQRTFDAFTTIVETSGATTVIGGDTMSASFVEP